MKPKLLSLPKRRRLRQMLDSGASPEAIIQRQEKAFDLRTKGRTLQSISQELGVAIGTVHNDLKVIARLKYEGLIEKDQNLLLEQNSYYDALLERWLPLAVSEDLNVGEKRINQREEEYDVSLSDWEASAAATDRVIKIMEAKAKINGLVSTKTDRTPEEVGASVALSVMEAFRRISQPKQAEVIIDAQLQDGI